MKASVYEILTAAALAIAVGSTPALAKDSAKIKGSLQNTGVEAAASGSIKAGFKLNRSQLELKMRSLTPSASYTVRVGGLDKAAFQADAGGSAKLKFRGPSASGSALPLDFDPRGQELTIAGTGGDVLRAVVSGQDQTAGIAADERVSLTATELAPGGEGAARYRSRGDGRASFEVEIEGVAAGTYDLFVDGTARGTIAVSTLGSGQVEFEAPAEDGHLALDFDPRGLQIDVSQNGSVFFTGLMRADAQGLTVCTYSETSVVVPSTGADPDGAAKARLRTRDDCRRSFKVEAEDIPVGSYDVAVAGVLRGTLNVIDNGVTIEGELEFETDDNGGTAFDFDPTNQLIEISQGATVFFSGVFAGGVTNGGDSQCQASLDKVPLLSSGAILGAKGDVKIRTRDDCDRNFSVEIEDVAVGTYDLSVDGVIRGTISVINNGLENVGEIEFDSSSDDPNELLLNFAVDGKVVEVLQGATVVLSRTLDGSSGSSGGSGGETCTDQDTRLDFDVVGPVSGATGDVRFREAVDCGRNLRVQVEDLPIGDYSLVVGGSVKGTITAANVGGKIQGEIELDTEPSDPSQLLLTFNPSGQLIEVVAGGITYLSISLP